MNTATRTARCRGLTLMLLGGGSRRGRRRGACGTGDLPRQERPDRLPALYGGTGEREDLLDVAERRCEPIGSPLALARASTLISLRTARSSRSSAGTATGGPTRSSRSSPAAGERPRSAVAAPASAWVTRQPAWSPDGRQILFMRALGPVVHDDAAELDLMVMNRDGSGQRLIRRFGRVVDGLAPGAEGKAEFSPDGRQIALTLGKLGPGPFGFASSAVYVMNADGSDLQSDHAGQASRRQPGLVAERQVARLPLQQLRPCGGLRSGS